MICSLVDFSLPWWVGGLGLFFPIALADLLELCVLLGTPLHSRGRHRLAARTLSWGQQNVSHNKNWISTLLYLCDKKYLSKFRGNNLHLVQNEAVHERPGILHHSFKVLLHQMCYTLRLFRRAFGQNFHPYLK